jgi:hypothetical protein
MFWCFPPKYFYDIISIPASSAMAPNNSVVLGADNTLTTSIDLANYSNYLTWSSGFVPFGPGFTQVWPGAASNSSVGLQFKIGASYYIVGTWNVLAGYTGYNARVALPTTGTVTAYRYFAGSTGAPTSLTLGSGTILFHKFSPRISYT